MNQSPKILLAAFESISSKGYANVSLRDIADEAGVVLSQLNYYYKNKEGLFTDVIKMMMQKYLQEVENHLRNGTTAMALWSASFGKLLCNLFEDLANLIEKHVLNNIPAKSNLRGYTSKSIARMLFGAMFGTAIQVILDPQEKTA